MLTAIRNFIHWWFYGNAGKYSYRNNSDVINRSNTKIVERISLIAFILMFGYTVISSIDGFLSPYLSVYIAFGAAFLLFYIAVYTLTKKNAALSRVFCYIFGEIVMVFGIYIGVAPLGGVETNATLFFVFLIGVPMLFFLPIVEVNIFVILNTAAFCLSVISVKSPEIYSIDLANAVASLFVSLIATHSLTCSRMDMVLSRERFAHASSMDELTQLSNRRAFNYYIVSAYDKNETLNVSILDIDNFKMYNDTYGHLEGDECLHNVGEVLLETANLYDFFVARYGGEEFVLVDCRRTAEQSKKILNDLIRRIEHLKIVNEKSPTGYVTMSAGLSSKKENATVSYTELINFADEALYTAKEAGKNRVVCCDKKGKKN